MAKGKTDRKRFLSVFKGITDEMVITRLASISLSEEKYGFNYSNFGYAVLGLVLEKIYNEEYQTIINNLQLEEGDVIKQTHESLEVIDGSSDSENDSIKSFSFLSNFSFRNGSKIASGNTELNSL